MLSMASNMELTCKQSSLTRQNTIAYYYLLFQSVIHLRSFKSFRKAPSHLSLKYIRKRVDRSSFVNSEWIGKLHVNDKGNKSRSANNLKNDRAGRRASASSFISKLNTPQKNKKLSKHIKNSKK